MEAKTELQKASEETMRFMRGNYALDEVPGKYYETDCLKFRQGRKTILSINIHEDRFDFQIIYGKAERDKFEARRGEFPESILKIYDGAQTLSDGKWMMLRVESLAALEDAKKMILIKKNPNRKPLPKERAVHSKCGYRCDLCVHYTGGTIDDETRADLKIRMNRIYDPEGKSGYWGENMDLCGGCASTENMVCTDEFFCEKRKCIANKNVEACAGCAEYPCYNESTHDFSKIHLRNISAEDVTKVILPYVPGQYGK